MTSGFDRFFETGWPHMPALRGIREMGGWAPGIDVFEKDGRLVTKVDLPGVKKEDVKVEVTDGHLSISGERKSEAEEKKDQYYRVERQYGSFVRRFTMPTEIDEAKVNAEFKDGVLHVTLPKAVAAVVKPVLATAPLVHPGDEPERPSLQEPAAQWLTGRHWPTLGNRMCIWPSPTTVRARWRICSRAYACLRLARSSISGAGRAT